MTHHSANMASTSTGLRDAFARHMGLIVPVCVMLAVLVMIVPLPPLLMDLLLAANITVAVVILLTTIQVGRPLEFSVFPSLLLGTTLARLVLNVGTTRLILSGAAERGTHAAGGVIAGFGDFVAAGSPAIGLTIFAILVVIQFLVITKGATRISEVAARFALDGMPGRQLAIDADLSAGAITADEAKALRHEVTEQADFYGAMDGASKFVRGDAVAGVVITLINIGCGLAIGIFQHGMSVAEAASVFTTLTIGDGLVSQLPAFLIAIAAGLLVTRTSTHSDLSRDALTQTFAHPVVLYLAATLLSALAFTGLPAVPLLALAIGCGVVGWMLEQSDTSETTAVTVQQSAERPSAPQAFATLAPLESEPIVLELGIGLLRLTDTSNGGDLLEGVRQLREQIAREMGYVVPKIRMRDNLRIGPREYQMTLHSVPVSRRELSAMPSTDAIIAELETTLRRHSHELLSRQQVHQLLEQLRHSSPGLVDEVIPGLLKVGQVHQVLTSLLREDVPIRNLETILEAIAVSAERTTDIVLLTEAARRSLARVICRRHCDANGILSAITLDPLGEAALAEALSRQTSSGTLDAASPLTGLLDELEQVVELHTRGEEHPVLVCRSDLRPALRSVCCDRLPHLAVLSRQEVATDVQIDVIAEIGQNTLYITNVHNQTAA